MHKYKSFVFDILSGNVLREIAIFSTVIILLIFISTTHAATAPSPRCNFYVSTNTTSYSINSTACPSFKITFAPSIKNPRLYCTIGKLENGSINIPEGDSNASLYGCAFSNATFIIGPNSSVNVINPKSRNFTVQQHSNNSLLTVAYTLNIRVFEPDGYNTTKIFGNRVGAFGYILPSFNSKIKLNSTELQMVPSYSQTIRSIIKNLRSSAYFPGYGAYGENSSALYFNHSGNDIISNKTFLLPYETYTNTSILSYNPYIVDYSFFAYDQLIMFNINITKPATLTPIYIQPVYPTFNFKILPNNGKKNLTIKWIEVLPNNDTEWNFTSYIYRYNADYGFSLNPSEKPAANGSSFADVVSYPKYKNYTYLEGYKAYLINYTSQIGIGMNSSIIFTNGSIPNVGTFVQDSTTPSFSYGIGFCSSTYGSTKPFTKVVSSGSYSVSQNLYPLISESEPRTVYGAPCGIGVYVMGKNIDINCNTNNINSTVSGFYVNQSENVTIENCNLNGGGINVINSTNVTFYNTHLNGTGGNSTSGVTVDNSDYIYFYNVLASNYKNSHNITNSNNVEFSNQPQSSTTIAPSANPATVKNELHSGKTLQDAILIISIVIIAAAYVYAFARFQYKPPKRAAKNLTPQYRKKAGNAKKRTNH